MTQWYVDVMGEDSGPYSDTQMRTMAERGQLPPDANVKVGSEGTWMLAASVQGLFPQQQIEAIARRNRDAARPPETGRVPVVSTTDYVSDEWRVGRTHSIVRSRRVYGINIVSEMLEVGATDFFGGRSGKLERAFEQMENEVLDDLRRQAIEKGCRALVRLTLQHGTIERGRSVMVYVSAQATPVTLVRIDTGIEIE